MSRQNKVNPGMYTQRGRLSQDDIARELARQRAAVEPPHGWKPEQNNPFQAPPEPKEDDAESGEQAAAPEPAKTAKKKPVRVKAKTAKPALKAKTATKTVRRTTAKAAGKAKTVKAKTSKAKTGKAKSVKRAKPATRAKAAKR